MRGQGLSQLIGRESVSLFPTCHFCGLDHNVFGTSPKYKRQILNWCISAQLQQSVSPSRGKDSIPKIPEINKPVPPTFFSLPKVMRVQMNVCTWLLCN